jgi:hypothetical protein
MLADSLTRNKADRPSDFRLSPNRKWLIWTNHVTDTGWPASAAAKLDGTHYRQWDRKREEHCFFADDSHVAEETVEPPSIILRDLNDPSRDRVLSYLGREATQVLNDYAAEHPIFVDVDTRSPGDGTDPPPRVKAFHSIDYIPFRASEYLDNIRPPAALAHANWPSYATLRDDYVSRDGSRVALQIHHEQPDPVLSIIHRVLPNVKAPTRHWTSVYVWYGQGSELRNLGRLPETEDSDDTYDSMLNNMEWLPGGRQLCLEYKKTLYLLDVDRKQ